MSDERLHRVLERLATHRADPDVTIGDALCATCVDVLELSGAGITLQAPGGFPHSIGASNRVMAEIHEIEQTLGEGPCIDAYAIGAPSFEPDLTHPATGRWPAFAAAASGTTEARAAFGFPLHIGAARFGALNLYAVRPGALTPDQQQDALVLADVSTHALVATLTSSPETLATELHDMGSNQLVVHQATGMVSAQLGVSIADALARLRACAFADDRPISLVAADVVKRRLRFDP